MHTNLDKECLMIVMNKLRSSKEKKLKKRRGGISEFSAAELFEAMKSYILI